MIVAANKYVSLWFAASDSNGYSVTDCYIRDNPEAIVEALFGNRYL